MVILGNINMKKTKQYKLEYTEDADCEKISLKGENSFILYKEISDGIELRQIFIDKKNRLKGLGTILVKELDKMKEQIVVASDAKEDSTFGKFLLSNKFKRNGQEPFMWKK